MFLDLRESAHYVRPINLVDEQHLVFECSALQGVSDKYSGLFGDHPATTDLFEWQYDTHAVAQFMKECMNAHGESGS